jgi:general secretion pathway protein G
MRFQNAFGCGFGFAWVPRSCLPSGRVRRIDQRSACASRWSARWSTDTAFSIIELLLVVAIICTLAAIGVPSLFAAVEHTRIVRAIADIHNIELDIKVFELTEGRLPNDLAEVGADKHLDPWGNPYAYTNLSNIKGKGKARKDRFLNPLNSDFDLYSLGKDGKSSTPLTAKASRDDIVRANDGAFIGLATDF